MEVSKTMHEIAIGKQLQDIEDRIFKTCKKGAFFHCVMAKFCHEDVVSILLEKGYKVTSRKTIATDDEYYIISWYKGE